MKPINEIIKALEEMGYSIFSVSVTNWTGRYELNLTGKNEDPDSVGIVIGIENESLEKLTAEVVKAIKSRTMIIQ